MEPRSTQARYRVRFFFVVLMYRAVLSGLFSYGFARGSCLFFGFPRLGMSSLVGMLTLTYPCTYLVDL